MLIIISLSGDPGVSAGIARYSGGTLVTPTIKRFPDGEIYIRIDHDLRGRDVLIVQSTYPDQDSKLMEVLLAIDAASRLGAASISVLFTYLAYMRQDKVFLKGEPVSLDVVLRTISSIGDIDKLYVVEPHVVWRDRFIAIDGVSPLAERFRDLDGILVVAPDKGGVERARRFYSLIKGSDLIYMVKKRDRYTGKVSSEIAESDADKVKNSHVVIVDDIVSTGGTLAEASRKLLSLGASSIHVACAHPLFVGDAFKRIKGAGIDKVVCGRTVVKKLDGVEYVDLSSHIARSIFG